MYYVTIYINITGSSKRKHCIRLGKIHFWRGYGPVVRQTTW